MAKYDIEVEYSDEETIEYSKEICVHRYNAGYRVPLGQVISKNFRCRIMITGGSITFFGRANDARIAKEVFEYAYEFAMKEGNRRQRTRLYRWISTMRSQLPKWSRLAVVTRRRLHGSVTVQATSPARPSRCSN